MGLLYTTQYIDFEDNDWKQTASDPPTFELLNDGISLEIVDTSQKQHNLKFKKGAKLKIPRYAGKFRLTWDDEYIIK